MLSDFYSVQSFGVLQTDEQRVTVEAKVTLNPGHAIFSGHFPGQPVVPGVCQVQMIRDLTERHLGIKTRMVASDNIKFLGMIDPARHPEIAINIQIGGQITEQFNVNAVISAQDMVFCKFKGKFIPDQECR